VAKLEQIPEKERLNPEAVVAAIGRDGRPAFYEETPCNCRSNRPDVTGNDVVTVFSNGDSIGSMKNYSHVGRAVKAVYDRQKLGAGRLGGASR